MVSLFTNKVIYLKYSSVLVVAILLIMGIAGCDVQELNSSNDDNPPGEDQKEQQWHKGNLHGSSYWSIGVSEPGNHFPEMVMKWYKNNGYDFAVLADHNTLQVGDKQIEVQKGSHTDNMFEEYLNEYGKDWVEYKDQDSIYTVGLKNLREYRPLLENSGDFVILNSQEIDYRKGGRLYHVNALNVQEEIHPPSEGGTVAEILQKSIDSIQSQSKSTGKPILPQVNHPNTVWSVSAKDMKELDGLRFFEVYSGHPNANNSGDQTHLSTDEIWDEVNTHYLRNGKELLYGTAVDDAHFFDTDRNGPGRGWVQVQTSSLSQDSLLVAMQRGDFYASTGVRLSRVTFQDDTLNIEIDAEEGISYTTKFIGTRKSAPDNEGVVLSKVEGTEASYGLSTNELYVRAKIISNKPKEDPSEEGEVEVAWVQPVVNE